MTSCAATTTIREVLEVSRAELYGLRGIDPDALAALASLEQLVEAAQALAAQTGLPVSRYVAVSREDYDAVAAALAAVGPGEETAE